MVEFLITNAETYTDRETNETTIHLFGRDVDGERHHVVVEDYGAHFYVRTEDVEGKEQEYIGTNGIVGLDHEVDFSAFGETTPLSKVEVETPRKVRSACDLFDQTFGADVTLDNWLRIEQDVKVWVSVPGETITPDQMERIEAPVDVDPEPRIVTLDIEVDDRGGFPDPGEKRITSIVAHDSYDGEYIGFLDGDGRDISKMFPGGKPEEVDKLYVEPNEKRMLVKFACWVGERDPDVLTAWNVDFDAPYLVERMRKVGASPNRLSPLNESYVKKTGMCRIRGLSIYDLLGAYKNNSWSELRSYSLDYVAGEELGASKIQHDRGFFEMFEEDPNELINYNARDTRLAVGINEKAGVIDFRDNLRKQIGVNFEQTRNNYQFVEMMARRKLYKRGEVGPTAGYGGDAEDYEGGYVMDAHSGVARNVMGIDVESLYPWTMFMLNASPDTKIDESRARRENIPYSKAPNGVCFRLDRDGLFKTLVKDALALKEGFRTLKNEAPAGSTEELIYEIKYAVSKTITNSIYGVIGWSRFFLYDRDTAEAVTLAGQEVVKASGVFVDDETDAEVIYGDTDSNYISFPTKWSQERCVDAALDICDRLEATVYPRLAEEMNVPVEDCEWRIDPEMFAPRFLQWGKKKKYAYLATWKEGMEPDAVMDEPETTIKGSAAKRSDSSRLTRDTEKKCIKAILRGRQNDCNQIVYEAATSLDPDDPDWDRIGIPGGIGQAFSEYDKPTAHVEAAQNANELLGTEFGEGSKPMRVYLRSTYFDELGEKTDRIAYEDADDLRPVEDRLTIDATRMTETLLTNPIGEMLNAVGVDVDAAVAGQTQTGLGAF